MAKIIFGAIVTGVRGKIDGTLFSANGSGVFAGKTKTTAKKAKPKGIKQSVVIGQNARYWRTLTEAQRNSFNENRTAYPRVNSLGQTYILSAFNFFVGLATQAKAVGGNQITQFMPPTNSDNVVNSITFGEITGNREAVDGYMTLTYTSANENSNTYFQWFVSAPVSAGKSTVSGAYKLMSVNQDLAAPFNVALEDYAALYGNYEVGDTVFHRVYAVNKVSGFRTLVTDDYKMVITEA